jgi:hypothetical protein
MYENNNILYCKFTRTQVYVFMSQLWSYFTCILEEIISQEDCLLVEMQLCILFNYDCPF